MAAELQNDGLDPQNSATNEVDQVRADLEDRARAQGWVPKEEWQGTSKWRDADEFVERGELFGKIDAQGRALKQTKDALSELTKHYQKVAETEYQRALKDLKAQKKEALEAADADEVLRLEDEIDQLREAKPVAKQAAAEPSQLHPEFVQWVQTNQWYAGSTPKHAAMRAWADTRGNELAAQGIAPADVLKRVAQEARVEFAGNFTNPNRQRASAVEGGGAPGTKVSSGRFELSEVEQTIMKKLVGAGALTKEEYIADIKKQRGVQ